MEQWAVRLIIVLAVILVTGGIILGILLWVRKKKHYVNVKKAKNKVYQCVKRYAMINFFKVIKNYTIMYNGEKAVIDTVLIGNFGVLLIIANNLPCELYNSPDGLRWIHKVEEKKSSVNNDLVLGEEYITAIRQKLSEDKIYKIKLSSIVVFTQKKLELYIDANPRCIRLKKLKSFLNRPEYSDHGDYDVNILYQQIQKYNLNK